MSRSLKAKYELAIMDAKWRLTVSSLFAICACSSPLAQEEPLPVAASQATECTTKAPPPLCDEKGIPSCDDPCGCETCEPGKSTVINGKTHTCTTPGCLALKQNPTSAEPHCNCMWEGPVHVTLKTAVKAPKALFVTGIVEWEPCCKPKTLSERVWKIDYDGVVSLETEKPQGDSIKLNESETFELAVAPHKKLLLRGAAQGSVHASELPLGELVDTQSSPPKPIKKILISVARSL